MNSRRKAFESDQLFAAKQYKYVDLRALKDLTLKLNETREWQQYEKQAAALEAIELLEARAKEARIRLENADLVELTSLLINDDYMTQLLSDFTCMYKQHFGDFRIFLTGLY
jgi:hypothetical protein